MQVRNVGEYLQWAKEYRVQNPIWTLSCFKDDGRPNRIILTHRPERNKYKIINAAHISPSGQLEADSWSRYLLAVKLLSKHGTEETKKELLLFGFTITFRKKDGRFGMFRISMDKGRRGQKIKKSNQTNTCEQSLKR